MNFDDLLATVRDEPVFETGLLLAGDVDPAGLQRQLSRWVKAGRLIQLRRGLYALAPPFQKVTPHPFLIANHLVAGSYISLQSALAYYGLIPEHVPVTTSVTGGRPGRWETALGLFEFRHVQRALLSGYRRVALGDRQEAWVAHPEKALLDLIHLESGADSPEYLDELRLQNFESLDLDRLCHLAAETAKPKLVRAADRICRMAATAATEYAVL
jgi:Transcriptional regulator, AbiEi antitoxin